MRAFPRKMSPIRPSQSYCDKRRNGAEWTGSGDDDGYSLDSGQRGLPAVHTPKSGHRPLKQQETHYPKCQPLFSLRMDFSRCHSIWVSSDVSDVRARDPSEETLLTPPPFHWNIPAPCIQQEWAEPWPVSSL